VDVSPRESVDSPPTGTSSGEPGAPVEPTASTPPTSKHAWVKTLVEWGGLIVAALVIALLIKTFLFQAFYIPSDSMVPTLEKNDRVIVNKLSYRLHDVHRGDIIVFKAPPGTENDIKDLVKRVIALPGEKVEGHGNHVYINGKQLEENYLPDGTITTDFPAEVVPSDSYWVMGDNRGESKDSRVFKFIPKKDIVGRVFLRIWPPKRIGTL
jgi:signal peptidase I